MSLCAEAGTRAAAPFPAPLSPLAASFLRFAPDRFHLTKPNTSCTIELPASLRSDGVRDHPGMPFGINLDLAFGFAGIPRREHKDSIHDVIQQANNVARPLSKAGRVDCAIALQYAVGCGLGEASTLTGRSRYQRMDHPR